MSKISRYDALLQGIANKLRPTTFEELNDMMAVVALFFTNPLQEDIDFGNVLLSIYLLDVTKVPMDSEVLKNHKKEYTAMLKAIHKFRHAYLGQNSTNEDLEGYAVDLKGKNYQA